MTTKTRSTGAAIYTVLCILLFAALALGMLLRPAEAKANELLASAPRLQTDGGLNPNWLSELADYVNDRFFLRQELISVRSRGFTALGGSASEDVITGADGWLYYAPTLDDYAGVSPRTDAELARMARNLYLMQEYCRSNGMRFLFTVAPNKNSVRGDAMPGRWAPAGVHDAERLLALLDGAGVGCVDLFSLFRETPGALYFAHDSHWNSRGAALAADAIGAAFGRESAWFDSGFSTAVRHDGDLYEMAYPAETDPETDPVCDAATRYTRLGNETRPDSITIRTENEGDGALAAFRDSFGNLLYPYLADGFARASFHRAADYDLAGAAASGADHLLIELVERNLDQLLQRVPVMPAPTRTLTQTYQLTGTAAAPSAAETRTLAGFTLLRGALPEGCDASRVYLIGNRTLYEAFHLENGAYAAYLPEGVGVQRVLYESGGRLFALAVDSAPAQGG